MGCGCKEKREALMSGVIMHPKPPQAIEMSQRMWLVGMAMAGGHTGSDAVAEADHVLKLLAEERAK